MSTHSRESSFVSSILAYPTSSSPAPDAAPCDASEPVGQSACIICYIEKNEDPEIFYIKQNGGFVSFTDDPRFMKVTRVFETRFEIFINSVGEFLPVSPDMLEWRFPSQKYSFFLLKKETLAEEDCPKINDWAMLLMDDIDEYVRERASSPLPPSSPLPESAPIEPTAAERQDVTTQTDKPVPSDDAAARSQRGMKRKYSESEGTGTRNITTFNINLNIMGHATDGTINLQGNRRRKNKGRKGKRRARNAQVHIGTGEQDDPIDVDAV
ncbi:hypothetical protein NP233_g6403 [Leucocoprinus birnbaumii]|uniref:Uncharacterized protein n=1 Tax=Leucocoprinus birnbaumii TaxID=56174 RepID=A0AAD5VWP1_9AGAR|nr:hypothetical protein NP233_g6403 [Leucocoprinus birnbaumii]